MTRKPDTDILADSLVCQNCGEIGETVQIDIDYYLCEKCYNTD